MFKGILDIANKIKNGHYTAVDVAKYYINNINKSDLNAFINFDENVVLKQAEDSDNRVKDGTARKYEGVPIAVKDTFCTKGVKTTAASALLENFVPDYDATVVEKLQHEGFIILGKTNCDEFATGSSNMTSFFGKVLNPWDKNRIPGGSSGGSAVAVAANLTPVAIGTDTGGSCRQPAAYTGIVGVCPTYGVCSRFGMIPLSSSLDRPGILAKNIEDAQIIYNVIKGFDIQDPSSECYIEGKSNKNITVKQTLKICIPEELETIEFEDEVYKQWQKSIKKIEESGVIIERVSIPSIFHAIDIYKVLAFSEIYSGLAKYDGTHFGEKIKGESYRDCVTKTRALFGDEIKRRLLIGAYMLSSDNYHDFYIQASKMRSKMIKEFNKIFNEYDIILMPSTTTQPPRFDENISPNQMYGQDLLTAPVNMTGTCAVSIPCCINKQGLPLGLQIIGDRFCDDKVYSFASQVEKILDFNKKA